MVSEESGFMYFCLDNVRIWCKSVIIHGETILNLYNEMLNQFKNREQFDVIRSKDISDLTSIEEYIFVISLNKTKDWLLEGKQLIRELNEMVKKIDKELPFIKEVRNMREHEIEYYKNKGRKQENFTRGVGECDISDATSTIADENGYLVGGRISVQVAIRLFNELLNEINILQQRLIYHHRQ